MVLNRENMSKYLNLEREINRINSKLDYYANNPVGGEHGVVKGSMNGFPYAECQFVVGAPDVKTTNEREVKVRKLISKLQEKKDEYEKMMFDIDIAIEEIEDMEMRQIVQLKYIERCTDEEIGKRLGFERSNVSKKLKKYFG